MENKHTRKFIIPCYDTDASMLLKPVSFMNYAQEAANRHASDLGFGYDDMMRTRMVWVLSRMHVKFLRHPLWRENVVLDTWHKGPERLFFLRDFKLSDTDGNPLVLATSSWLVLNMDTRRITRDVGLEETGTVLKEDALAPSCGKVQMPSGVEQQHVRDHTVSYSDLDMNGHTNNAMYIQWAMDAVDQETAMKSPLKELRINFNHETRAGEIVSLYRSCAEEGEDVTYCVEGRMESGGEARSAFCVELVF